MEKQAIAQLFDLTGKGAVVTGGAKGIGQAIAFRLAEAGASVMIADIDLETASQTAEQIKASDGIAQAVRAEARSMADAYRVAQSTTEAFGSLDILVNNAGIYPFSSVLDTSEELWDKVIDINLKGMFAYSQAAAQQMIANEQGGKIINIASIDALKPHGFVAHYNASKGGVVMLTKALALELAPHKILVNAVAPGTIITPGTDAIRETVAQEMGMLPEQLLESFLPRVPLQRAGEPDDVAKVVLFLASAAADYITGDLLVVDGGYLLS